VRWWTRDRASQRDINLLLDTSVSRLETLTQVLLDLGAELSSRTEQPDDGR